LFGGASDAARLRLDDSHSIRGVRMSIGLGRRMVGSASGLRSRFDRRLLVFRDSEPCAFEYSKQG
jgi:hypothetical protein